MPFFLTDDKIHSHRKVRSMPKAERMPAMGLWLMAGSWCRDQLSDGVVPTYMIAEFGGTKRQAVALVKAGLWVEHQAGYEFVNWAQWQDTREKVERKRHAWNERQQRSRGAKKERDSHTSHASVTRDKSVSHGGVTESSSHSISSTNSGYVQKETHPSSAAETEHRVEDEPVSTPVLPSTSVLARRYTDRVQLSDRAKVCGVVQAALNAGYSTDQIGPALERLAADGRPVTPDTLRIEIEGRRPSRASPSTTDQRVQAGLDLAQKYAEQERRLEVGA